MIKSAKYKYKNFSIYWDNTFMDTVTIRLIYPDFMVIRPDYFSPRANFNKNHEIDSKAGSKDVYKRFVQHQTQEDKLRSIYKPVLTLTQRMKTEVRALEWFLSIQVSIPRVLYSNNVYEVSPRDSDRIFTRLTRILLTMGIQTKPSVIARGIVTKFHIGKNIVLSNDYTVSQVIELLSKTVAARQTKKRVSHYENDGEAFHFYTSSHDRIFYNKLKDYERTKNTAVDKNRLKAERFFGKQLKEKGLQILRFEARYNGQQTVTSKLKNYLNGDESVVRFEALFDDNLWKNVLIHEWVDIIGVPASQLSLKFEIEPDKVLQAFLNHSSSGKNRNVYALNETNDLYGTYVAIQTMGVQTYRNLMEQTFSGKTLGTRLEEKIALIEAIIKDIPVHPIIKHIDEEIHAYKRLTPEWLEENVV